MKKKLYLLLISLFLAGFSFGQNYQNAFDYQIYYETTSADSLVYDSLCTRVCKVTVTEVSTLAYIKVKIGTSNGSADIMQHNFLFNVVGGLPNGLSFNREGNVIYLGLQNTYQADTYFYEVQLEDIYGNTTISKKWH